MLNFRTLSSKLSVRRFPWVHLALAVALGCSLHPSLRAQSTFATVLGTVKEASGAVVPNAKVQFTNTGTNAVRSTLTNSAGGYEFVNVEVGTYTLEIQAPGFSKMEFTSLTLQARESRRVDAQLSLATQSTTVNVESSAGATIQTDTSSISETKGSRELTDLPVAIGSRASGSTSAFSTLTAQPGVQTDTNNNIMVAGALPSQLSVSVDGISSVGPGSLGALTEVFPSFYAIEEIKISETLNPAEFGGVADITTVSKSGTNNFHGGLFYNGQNTAMNAADTFSHIVTPVKLNDFGGYVGGPLILPKVYNGKDKTFIFASTEVLRLPKSFQFVESVPSLAMRSGNLTAYDGSVIPASQINPYAIKLMDFFLPTPNYGAPGAVSNNYLATYSTPINSAQADGRVDQVINSKNTVYVRYSFKNRRLTSYPQDANGNPGSPLVGSTSRPEIYNSMVAAYNWVVSPSIVNELRGGFTKIHRGASTAVTSQQAADFLGLTTPPLPGPIPGGYATPTLDITGFMGSSPQAIYTNPHEGSTQVADSLTWTKSKHTFKFGADFRYLDSLFSAVFANYQMGSYSFNGSATGLSPFAGFMMGYPDLTGIATVINPSTDAVSKHYAVFAQDDWKVTPSLTINYGLRYEYNPAFRDSLDDVANFDPNYSSTSNGQVVNGAVILPNQKAFVNLNPGFAQSIAPTPIITAAQAGVPPALRDSSKLDFAPRIGFAWRVGGNNKTVIRGGYGRFIETLLSASAINGWSVGASDVGYFSNTSATGGQTPMYSMPYSFPSDIAQPGTQYFDLASAIKFKDPIVEEWNLTVERDLGKGIGVRASYTGNHSYNVPTIVNANQVHANTLGFNDPATQASIPFPLLSYIATWDNHGFGNYNAGTVSVHKNSSSFQFQASYTYTRDLTNVNGCGVGATQGFVSEFGQTQCDPYNPGIDYGNTSFDRRQRFLVTFRYDLPFGRGRTFLNSANRWTDLAVGGWSLSGVGLIQTGPFMNVTTLNDPAGTGYNIFNSNGGRADTVAGVNPYAGQSLTQWINPNAFVDPPNNIGRFGDSQQGSVVGPGTKTLSASLLKRFTLREGVYLEVGAQVANLFNHPNYAPPNNLTLDVPAFAAITAMQVAEGAGPRVIQLTGRLTF